MAPGSYLPADADVSYTWLRDGKAVGTGRNLLLGVHDVGERISLRVDLSHPGYRDRSLLLQTDHRVTTTPELDVKADGKPGRAVVRIRVTAPGVDTAPGRVIVKIGKRQVSGRLVDGRLRLVLDDLEPGTRTVKVRYSGTQIVRPGRTSTTVKISRQHGS